MTNKDIEAKARSICINLGLDPDERVEEDTYGDAMTPQEQKRFGGAAFDAITFSDRWVNYRRQAALWLAENDK